MEPKLETLLDLQIDAHDIPLHGRRVALIMSLQARIEATYNEQEKEFSEWLARTERELG